MIKPAGSKKEGCYFDFTEFDRNFRPLVKKCPEDAQAGLEQGGGVLLADAITVEPTVPKEWGPLRRSQKVEVEVPAGQNKPISIMAGFDTPYATYQHEGKRADGTHVVDPANYTTPGTGRKFLETKLIRFPGKYMNYAVERIKARLAAGSKAP